MRLTSFEWHRYSPRVSKGKLCYYNCTTKSDLPLRDLLGGLTEPNYETMTYNCCGPCLQKIHLRPAVNDGISLILFATTYYGTDQQFVGRQFIVGYYEIGGTTTIDARAAVCAKKLAFTRIEDAFEVTPEKWNQINPKGKKLKSHRTLTQHLPRTLSDEIINHLDAHDATADYVREVARLKSL